MTTSSISDFCWRGSAAQTLEARFRPWWREEQGRLSDLTFLLEVECTVHDKACASGTRRELLYSGALSLSKKPSNDPDDDAEFEGSAENALIGAEFCAFCPFNAEELLPPQPFERHAFYWFHRGSKLRVSLYAVRVSDGAVATLALHDHVSRYGTPLDYTIDDVCFGSRTMLYPPDCHQPFPFKLQASVALRLPVETRLQLSPNAPLSHAFPLANVRVTIEGCSNAYEGALQHEEANDQDILRVLARADWQLPSA